MDDTLSIVAMGTLAEAPGWLIYYLQSRPIIERLNPDFKTGRPEITAIAEHISRFSLAALAGLTRQARRA